MRILILDDDENRHNEFARRYEGHDLVHAYTAKDAQTALKAGGFDLATLDHDLGDYHEETGPDDSVIMREMTGYDVVGFLVREVPRDRWPAEMIVHSWNAPRARMMTEILRDHGVRVTYKPFIVG